MIKIKDLDKWISSRFQKQFILKGIDLDIEEGEFISIMGPSGSGKSTLLNVIGLLDKFDAGEYYFRDEPIHKFSESQISKIQKREIGFVFQSYHLLDELTVYENIETPLLYRGVDRKERASLVAEILDRFQMVAKKDLFPEQLSGGQQQLVGIARAVIGNPKLLLADEPTGNLHSSQGEEVMNYFQQLNKAGMTIIQVTHNEKFAECGQRVIQLNDGAILKG
jgi:putative ABC transport system ATP-binding protein